MFCKVELYIVRWDLSWPERLFLHFFRKLFRTRLCQDYIYYFAQKKSFLQRRKSVCKRSFTVRGMQPPQGPTCVRTLYRIHAKTIEKNKKVFVRITMWLCLKITSWSLISSIYFAFWLVRASACFMGIEDQNIALVRFDTCLMGEKTTDFTC